MSLVRAFTTRRINRPEILQNSFLSRAASQRSPPSKSSILRSQISAPVALISTTNNLCYDAPDIAGTSPIAMTGGNFSSASSVTSGSAADDSDASSTSIHSRDTFTDASSVGDSSPPSPEPNHLSCYFKPSVYTDVASNTDFVMTGRQAFDAPIVPQRAASHSKKAHVQLSRSRSVQRAAVAPPAVAQDLTRESIDFFQSPSPHPFGKELEQLNEVAEEFGSVIRDAEADADHVFMEAHGLATFSSSDYSIEISGLLASVFEEESSAFEEAGWI